MSRRFRRTLLDWSAINPRELPGRWFLLERPRNEAWRGFIDAITIYPMLNEATIRAVDLQYRQPFTEWFEDHPGPPPPFSIGFGVTSFQPDCIFWRCRGTRILFRVPHTPPRACHILEPQLPRVDPQLLRSSGGAYLRRHL